MATIRVQRSRATTVVSLFVLSLNQSLSFPFSSKPFSPAGGGNDDDAVISTAVLVLREHRSKSRWNYLRFLCHPAGFTPSQAAGITVRLRNNPHLALRFFLWSHRRRLCRHDLSSYAAIVHVLARSRLRPAALSLLQSAIRSNDADVVPGKPPPAFEALARTYRACDSAPFVFDLLIRAYLQSKKLDQALQVARLLRSRGIHPQVPTSNSLILSVSRSRGSDAAIEIYRELFSSAAGGGARVRVSPNTQTFNTLLLACFREGRQDAAELILGDMENSGCYPNVFTYSVLMAGLCEDGRIEVAKKLWEEMAAKQIKPDIVAFNTLIGGYCEAGEVERSEELFRDMELSGIEPTGTTFEHLIRGHFRAGDADTALLVFGDMRRRGFSTEVALADEVIDEMCKKGKVEEGLGILREEMKREGGRFSPSRISYELLIRGFCKKGDLKQALKLQAEMAGKGFEADQNVYRAFIEGYNKQGDVEKAGRLEDEMLEMCRQKEEDYCDL